MRSSESLDLVETPKKIDASIKSFRASEAQIDSVIEKETSKVAQEAQRPKNNNALTFTINETAKKLKEKLDYSNLKWGLGSADSNHNKEGKNESSQSYDDFMWTIQEAIRRSKSKLQVQKINDKKKEFQKKFQIFNRVSTYIDSSSIFENMNQLDEVTIGRLLTMNSQQTESLVEPFLTEVFEGKKSRRAQRSPKAERQEFPLEKNKEKLQKIRHDFYMKKNENSEFIKNQSKSAEALRGILSRFEEKFTYSKNLSELQLGHENASGEFYEKTWREITEKDEELTRFRDHKPLNELARYDPSSDKNLEELKEALSSIKQQGQKTKEPCLKQKVEFSKDFNLNSKEIIALIKKTAHHIFSRPSRKKQMMEFVAKRQEEMKKKDKRKLLGISKRRTVGLLPPLQVNLEEDAQRKKRISEKVEADQGFQGFITEVPMDESSYTKQISHITRVSEEKHRIPFLRGPKTKERIEHQQKLSKILKETEKLGDFDSIEDSLNDLAKMKPKFSLPSFRTGRLELKSLLEKEQRNYVISKYANLNTSKKRSNKVICAVISNNEPVMKVGGEFKKTNKP